MRPVKFFFLLAVACAFVALRSHESSSHLRSSERELQAENGVTRVTVAGLGDILMLPSLAKEVYKSGFSHLLQQVEPLWAKADFVFANFEGVTGEISRTGVLEANATSSHKKVFTNSIKEGGFNYSPEILWELRESGVNVLSTANNHAFDRGFKGIDSTLSLLQSHNFTVVGSRATNLEPSSLSWVSFSVHSGVRIAWLACTNILCPTCRRTFSAPLEKVKRRILQCSDALPLLVKLRREKLADLIFIAPHWGSQFKEIVPRSVEKIAIRWLEAGVDVIFGNHPHILQRSFSHVTGDGRQTYCMFSLGSLTSGLGSYERKKFKQRASAVVLITYERRYGERPVLRKVEVKPICEIWKKGERAMVPAGVDCTREMLLTRQLLESNTF